MNAESLGSRGGLCGWDGIAKSLLALGGLRRMVGMVDYSLGSWCHCSNFQT